MMVFLLGFILLAVIVAVALAWYFSETRWAGQDLLGHRSTKSGRPPRARCLPCYGTGRLGQESERTLNVRGDGFEDRRRPAVPCPACGGTGRVPGPR